MTINANNLILQVNSLLTCNPQSNTNTDKLILAASVLQRKAVNEKRTCDLGSTNSNEAGKLAFNVSDCKYYFSNGSDWNSVFGLSKNASCIFSFGRNSLGQLSDGTQADRSSPVSLILEQYSWCQVSLSDEHTVALKTNGTLWAWGVNTSGRLGNNTTNYPLFPVSVVGGFTDWCQASAGGSHTAAVRQNGTLWTWGSGTQGQLGDGTAVTKSSPVSIVGGFTDWCQVSAGGCHTVAIRTNGTIWAWGNGANGRLGDNTTVAKSSPVSVVGGFTDWCQVSAAFEHTAAVRQNGTLWAWGNNGTGFLGDNTAASKTSPVSVVGGFTDWCQVSAGRCHTAAVRTNGTLWAWGDSSGTGKLGDGTAATKSSPVSVVGGFTDWCQVSAGQSHTAAVRQNGTLWTWGCATYGRLGNGYASGNRCSPVSVVGGFTDWCQVAAGSCHTTTIRNINQINPYL